MPWRDVANQPLVRSEFTGQMIATWSEAWRHETEIAYLLSMPPNRRNELLDGIIGSQERDARGIKNIRGEAAVAELRASIQRLGEIRRAKPGPA